MSSIALITGAAGALGSDLSRVLHEKGYLLALLDTPRGKDRLDQLAKELGGKHWVGTGDLEDASAWTDIVPQIEKKLGGAPTHAALIAGTWKGGRPFHEEPDDIVWTAMMATNLETVHRSFAALLPGMVLRKSGSIVVIGSRAVPRPWTSVNAAGYAVSKSAVVTLAEVLAQEVMEHGVRINAILPSTMDTAANRAAMPKVDPAKWVSTRSAAGVVAFLLSEEARDITGAAIPVYGRA